MDLKSAFFRFRVQLNFRTPPPPPVILFSGSPDPGGRGSFPILVSFRMFIQHFNFATFKPLFKSVTQLNLTICFSSSSIWQVEKTPGSWKTLNLELSSWLEDAWNNEDDERVTVDDKAAVGELAS